MDPQQSCILETVCSFRSSLPDSAIDKFGVFVGVAPSGYNIDLLKHTTPGPFHGMAMGTSVVCGRISFIFGFRGPSVCIDTACSSSLVGLHLGMERGEVYNLVSGVHIMPNGTSTSYLLSAGMLTEDGRCKTLDAKADGYVRAEACCTVLLAPVSEASGTTKKAAVRLRGSAVNQDGRSSSLTAPNGPSQQQVMLASLKRAGTSPASVTVLEMHGTGTPLGDPIEVGAAGAVLWTDRRAPLVWAAAKSAVGHAEPGAGLVGLLNAATVLSHRVGKQIMHLRSINPHVEGVLGSPHMNFIPRELCSLTSSEEAHVCGALSSFAFQGTNAHSTFAEVGSAALKWLSSTLFSRTFVSVLQFKNALCQSVSSKPICATFAFDVKNAFLS